MRPADRYAAFLLDLDGVVYRGDEVIPGAAEGVAALREAGRRVVFLTNNSAWTPEHVAERLTRMGMPASPNDVVSAAQATGLAVARDARTSDRPATAFLIGEEGLRRALAEAGVEVVVDDAPGYVVVGWDRGLDYEKLRRASVLVRSGSRLVAANADATFPAPGGELWPGAGALLAAVETAAGERAMVVGKPQRALFDVALARAGTRNALVVGDRLETDVAGAHAAELDSALALTGAGGLRDLLDRDAQPTAVVSGLDELLAERPWESVRDARGDDERGARSLLRASALDEGEWSVDDAVVAGEGEVVATAAADVAGRDAYLRSVAVREAERGAGLGALAVAAAARRAARAGATRAWLLTESAEGFFGRLGFRPVDRADLPGWIRERSRTCADSAVAMARELRPG